VPCEPAGDAAAGSSQRGRQTGRGTKSRASWARAGGSGPWSGAAAGSAPTPISRPTGSTKTTAI